LSELWHDILTFQCIHQKFKPLFMRKTLGLLLAAAAAFGIYKYSKMTPQQKKDLREKGKDFLDKKMRTTGNLFTKKRPVGNI
jgi:hypothetical protein